MESRNLWCIRVGELALLRGEWRLRGTAPDGSPLELASRTAEVVRRQPDGSWLYVIDHAFEADNSEAWNRPRLWSEKQRQC